MQKNQNLTWSMLVILIAGLAWAGDKKAAEKPISIELNPVPVDVSMMLFRIGKTGFEDLQDADTYLILGAVNKPTTAGEPWMDVSSVRPFAFFNGATVAQVSLNGLDLQQGKGQWPRQYTVSPHLVDHNLGFGSMVTWSVVDGRDSFTAQVPIPPGLAPSVSCGSRYSLSSGAGFTLQWENPQGGDVGVYAHFYPDVDPIGSRSLGVFSNVVADSGTLNIRPNDLRKITQSGWLNILIGRASYDSFQYGSKKAVAGATAEETITVHIVP